MLQLQSHTWTDVFLILYKSDSLVVTGLDCNLNLIQTRLSW